MHPGVDFWRGKKWRTRVYKNGKRIYMYFGSEKEAIEAYEQHYKDYPKKVLTKQEFSLRSSYINLKNTNTNSKSGYKGVR